MILFNNWKKLAFWIAQLHCSNCRSKMRANMLDAAFSNSRLIACKLIRARANWAPKLRLERFYSLYARKSSLCKARDELLQQNAEQICSAMLWAANFSAHSTLLGWSAWSAWKLIRAREAHRTPEHDFKNPQWQRSQHFSSMLFERTCSFNVHVHIEPSL